MMNKDPFSFAKAPKAKGLKMHKPPTMKLHAGPHMGKPGGKNVGGSFPLKSKASRKKSAYPKITFNEF